MSSGRTGAYPLKSRIFVRTLLVIGAVCAFLGTSAFVASTVSAQQSETMVASWYGPGFEGLATASGEPFNPQDYTAAHKTLPFDTRMIVTYEGRSVVVRINDRGPYITGRDLDLSQAAADAIGLTAAGEGVVEVTYTDASVPTGPYSGGAVSEPAPEQPAPEQPAPVQNTPAEQDDAAAADGQYDNAADDQYVEDDVPVQDTAAGDQYNAADDQYDAADDQYDDSNPVELNEVPVVDQYDDSLAEETAAPAAPVTPVAPPAPTAETVEAPPVELAVPGSTVEKRIETAVAAPPVDYTGPLPETPIVEVPVAEEAPVVAPAVASGDEELPSVASGLTVLPDTGGIPVMPIAGAAVLVSILAGVGILRR